MPKRTPKTRNAETWTEARYWSAIRSALRQAFRYWKPIQLAKAKARVSPGRYRCAACKQLYSIKQVQVDHTVPCGSLKCLDDIAGFIERLTPEDIDAFQVLCKPCHQIKTNIERERSKKHDQSFP